MHMSMLHNEIQGYFCFAEKSLTIFKKMKCQFSSKEEDRYTFDGDHAWDIHFFFHEYINGNDFISQCQIGIC